MSYQCVPLYDTLGENAVEYIINHSEVRGVLSGCLVEVRVLRLQWRLDVCSTSICSLCLGPSLQTTIVANTSWPLPLPHTALHGASTFASV
jgi:hypothetical protein